MKRIETGDCEHKVKHRRKDGLQVFARILDG
jgi:hypothetical protein